MSTLLTTPQTRPLVALPAVLPRSQEHRVQFYEAEEALIDSVTRFIGAGLRAGEPVVVIATPEHRAAFCERLGMDAASGRLALLDARDTLGQFMVGDEPDWARFQLHVGGALRAAAAGGGARVCAYGEMVDLLWREGNRTAALRLEEMWNEIAKEHAFSLLCAYVMGNFYKSSDAEAFQRVCAAHTHVTPYASDVRPDELGRLQQRARALESEIAHREELEVALRESLAREKALREDAERSVHFADVFCGMLGHDLRNPLGAINMGASYIARSSLGEKPTRAATRIIDCADRMARMIDQLFDFTRIRAAGGLELRRSRTDIAVVCERVKEELEAGDPSCSIRLATSGNTGGFWDHDRLAQVLSNLLGNAVTHGSKTCEVSVEADGRDSADVVTYVRNAGAIDAEVLPAIFDPFRGGRKHPNTKGLGLGLFITRQIVLAHGGDISVISSDSAGTQFRVRLPRAPRTTDLITL